jgi:hypothetical protein
VAPSVCLSQARQNWCVQSKDMVKLWWCLKERWLGSDERGQRLLTVDCRSVSK